MPTQRKRTRSKVLRSTFRLNEQLFNVGNGESLEKLLANIIEIAENRGVELDITELTNYMDQNLNTIQ
ncbi:hypothetical protein [Phaeodactylibacter xiamenensis]|jgi:hypothetical protein|uniref:hypothetical protein n=1 Tax=Phaeodactylibacter xiamenensis TaxID=1524460 RepID=UPI003CCBDB82